MADQNASFKLVCCPPPLPVPRCGFGGTQPPPPPPYGQSSQSSGSSQGSSSHSSSSTEHSIRPCRSIPFTGSPSTYPYLFQLVGLVGFAAPVFIARYGSGVKNRPVPGLWNL